MSEHLSEHLGIRWTVSRGRDTYGYNICTLTTEDGRKYRCNGGGYDMEGTVFGHWLADNHQEALLKLDPEDYYGLRFYEGKAYCDGACGIESMKKIAKGMGLDVRTVWRKRGGTEAFIVEKIPS